MHWRANPDAANTSHATAQVAGTCAKGLAPEAGEARCNDGYEANARFAQAIISAMLKEEGPMAMPIPLGKLRRQD